MKSISRQNGAHHQVDTVKSMSICSICRMRQANKKSWKRPKIDVNHRMTNARIEEIDIYRQKTVSYA